MSDKHELKSCPFCGGDAEFWNGLGTQADVSCNDCGVAIGLQVTDILDYEERYAPENDFNMETLSYPPNIIAKANEELASEWNARPTEDKLVEALEAIKKHQETVMRGKYELSTTWQIANKALAEVLESDVKQ